MGFSKPLVNYSISINNWLVISAFIIGLGTILYGVFNLSWYINEISAIFLIVTIASGIIAGMEETEKRNCVKICCLCCTEHSWLVCFYD